MENHKDKVLVNKFVIDDHGNIHSEGTQEVLVEEGPSIESSRGSEIPENTNSGVEGGGKPNYASSGDLDSSDVSDMG